MAFALTSFAAYSVGVDSPVTTRIHQVFTMKYSGTSSDITLDVGAYTAGSLGTFWTAVIANATTGALAATALAALQVIGPNADVLLAAESTVGRSYGPVGTAASVSTHQYQITNPTAAVPSLLVNTAEGLTAGTYTVVIKMLPGIREVRAGTP